MIRIMQVGLGPLGQKMVEFALQRGLQIVAAVDADPQIAGKRLQEICPASSSSEAGDLMIHRHIGDACLQHDAQVALVTTVSAIRRLEEQVTLLAEHGLHVVSTCEELSFPWNAHPGEARRIDQAFRRNGVVCLGTGVNPGYLMDLLPSVLTGVCRTVEGVRVWRVQDASPRRIPFQQKIGAGLSVEAFQRSRDAGTLRHVGLRESMDFIADRLGWKLDRTTETLEPVMAEKRITTGYRPIEPGQTRGVEQIGRGFVGDSEVITLSFRAAVGEEQSYERVEIEGEPPVGWRCDGGINGDIATCAVTLNSIPPLLQAAPGLRTMGEIGPVSGTAMGTATGTAGPA